MGFDGEARGKVSGITATSVLKYATMPGIIPRLKRLFGTGFSHLAFLMAQIYVMVGLLPATHPYNNPQNTGRYGIRHVIAESANNLVLSRQNIDKILIFVAILAGAVLLFAQIALFIFMTIIEQAWAGPFTGFTNIFDTEHADTDLAFFLLARVFGVPDFFCSPISGACPTINGEIPYPIHEGLHALFGFYSFGLLLIGMLIFLYFLVVIVAESAATGSAFGQRFKNVWVPIRLIVAIGLLVPLNYELNSGQYITLYSAKLGSSLATNGWFAYNNAIADHSLFGGGGQNPTGELETLIGMPKSQTIAEVIEFMSLVHTCAYTYWRFAGEGENRTPISFNDQHYQNDDALVKAYFAKTDPSAGGAVYEQITGGHQYTNGLEFYDNGNIHIVFGHQNDDYTDKGSVKPLCGEIVIPVSSLPYDEGGDLNMGAGDYILQAYFNLVNMLWDRSSSHLLRAGAIRIAEVEMRSEAADEYACSGEALEPRGSLPSDPYCATQVPGWPNLKTVSSLELMPFCAKHGHNM